MENKIIKFQIKRYKKLAAYWYGRGEIIHAAICEGIVQEYKDKL